MQFTGQSEDIKTKWEGRKCYVDEVGIIGESACCLKSWNRSPASGFLMPCLSALHSRFRHEWVGL